MAAPNILCDTAGMTNAQWLAARMHGPSGKIPYTVGGSDVAAVFGVSPWTTPLELWMIKKGRMKPSAKSNANQLEMGHLLEPIAAHWYAKKTGNRVYEDTNLYQHADHPYALANFDRRFERASDGEPGILECKSCTYHKASEWDDGAIPLYYELQLRFYLAVADVNIGSFSAIWGNNPDNDLAIPDIIRDKAKEDMIFERLDEWIWGLEHDKPPTMSGVAPQLALESLARIYGESQAGLPTIEFSSKQENALRRIALLQGKITECNREIKTYEKEIEAYSVRIAEIMKEHEHGVLMTTSDKPYSIMIDKVMVFPQAYAAVVPKSSMVVNMLRVFVVDIGGYTTDVLLLKNGKPDLQFCRSLETGIITMNNEIIRKVGALHDMRIEDEHISAVLSGQDTILSDDVKQTICGATKLHAQDVLNQLRELQVDLRSNPAVFIGGGSLLLRPFLEASPLVAKADFVESPNANALGYEMLGRVQLSHRPA